MKNNDTIVVEPDLKRFFCRRMDKIEGPFDVIELAAQIKYANIDGDTPICREGAEDWASFRDLPEFVVAQELSIEEIARHLEEKERAVVSRGLPKKPLIFSWSLFIIYAVIPLGITLLALVTSHPQNSNAAPEIPPAIVQKPTHFVFAKQYRAEFESTSEFGHGITTTYADNGKMRIETNLDDDSSVLIFRPDRHKIYQIMVEQRTIIERPYDTPESSAGAIGEDAKYETVGSEVLNGINCTKYKVTTGKTFYFFWVDTAKQVPVKTMARNNHAIAVYRSYQPGPQDPSLFEPPTGYKWVYSD